jgi:hypothetical protein
MTEQHDLTANQKDYAVFLPAISSFYANYVGRQRTENYIDATRMPKGIADMEQLNWLNPQKGLFPYKWSLYSAGHADLDLTKFVAKEDMVRNRDPGSTILGDSGGFQIAKGVWEGDWRAGSGCPKAQKHRETALSWLDGIADYAMVLDIPSFVINEKNGYKSCISTLEEAADATKYNNEYFMKHRKGIKNGGTKFLNVLQGGNHNHADEWYEMMKGYCDPAQYPDTHFNGWAMGGQNMCDIELVLKRLVELRFDGLLEQGKHDWMHFLGTSKLEWAVLLTDIKRAVRKYHNPDFDVSFDCASPFLATANGQIYIQTETEDRKKWTYRMTSSADDKKYAQDTRLYKDAVIQDGILKVFESSPIIDQVKLNEICIYGPNDRNKFGQVNKTSWDSFSYGIMMGHNVWHHVNAVQEANRQYDAGRCPNMLVDERFDRLFFKDIVEAVFATSDKGTAQQVIKEFSGFWNRVIGTRGASGRKAITAETMFTNLFDEVVEPNVQSNIEHSEDFTEDEVDKLDQLEAEVEDDAT